MPWHFNPLPSCEGRLRTLHRFVFHMPISIHSPHARGDLMTHSRKSRKLNFNPLPSCEGRRRGASRERSQIKFQSTPLMRGETGTYLELKRAGNFNPLPSCEGRRTARFYSKRQRISIHSPHARGDRCAPFFYAKIGAISIHSPHARGDEIDETITKIKRISIHSPHTRGDSGWAYRRLMYSDFNPLPSCEGRPCNGFVAHMP